MSRLSLKLLYKKLQDFKITELQYCIAVIMQSCSRAIMKWHRMKLIIIAALNRKRVIGKDGKLPWHISEDMKRVKQLTTGHTILMGRKTYESLGKPLPNRRNVVLSSKTIPGVETYQSLDSALTALSGQDKVFVFGGGKVFAETLHKADEMYLTVVDQDIDGDTFFPPYEEIIKTNFTLVREEKHTGFVFLDYSRRKK
jgi:dihydrofolate reductase